MSSVFSTFNLFLWNLSHNLLSRDVILDIVSAKNVEAWTSVSFDRIGEWFQHYPYDDEKTFGVEPEEATFFGLERLLLKYSLQ